MQLLLTRRFTVSDCPHEPSGCTSAQCLSSSNYQPSRILCSPSLMSRLTGVCIVCHSVFSRRFYDGCIPVDYRISGYHIPRPLQPPRPPVDEQLVLPGNGSSRDDLVRSLGLHPHLHVRGALLKDSIPLQVAESRCSNGDLLRVVTYNYVSIVDLICCFAN